MEPERAAAQPSRQTVSKVMKVALAGCVVLLVIGVVVVAMAGMRPAPLAALSAGAVCLAGILDFVFWAMDKWARDSEYSLQGNELTLLLVLAGVGIALVFWSTSL